MKLCFFRGEPKDYGKTACTAGIFREAKYIKNESKIYGKMLLAHPNEFSKDKTSFEKLARMQHYGLPTRLLDFTQNPLVALYFASGEEKDENVDGRLYMSKSGNFHSVDSNHEVVSFAANILNNSLFLEKDHKTIINNSKKIYDAIKEKAKKVKENDKKNPNIELKESINDLLKIFKKLKKELYFKNLNCGLSENFLLRKLETIFSPLFIFPSMNNERIKMQSSVFMFTMFNDIALKKYDFVFSVKNKKKIRDELKLLNITQHSLFQSMEYTAKEIIDSI